ncbi:MAG: hypothetical protein M1838_002827 [Thelocarpon superellum]|nr:MAG: hypothetical protein M1838_002827 [Thelocarpon superellum]
MATEKIVVVVTGANSGIGFQTVRLLASDSEKYHVFLGGRSLERVTEAMSSLKATGLKGSIAALQLDLLDDASIERAIKTVQEQFGRLDVLINNAGIVVPPGDPVRNMLRQTFETNTFGQAAVTEAFAPLLLQSADPRLLFLTTSLASLAYASDPAWVSYARPFVEYRASKAALNMLVVQYHKDLGAKGIKVWAIDPGALQTNLLQEYIAKVPPPPMKRGHVPGKAEDGAEVVVGVVEGKRDAEVGKAINKTGVLPW